MGRGGAGQGRARKVRREAESLGENVAVPCHGMKQAPEITKLMRWPCAAGHAGFYHDTSTPAVYCEGQNSQIRGVFIKPSFFANQVDERSPPRRSVIHMQLTKRESFYMIFCLRTISPPVFAVVAVVSSVLGPDRPSVHQRSKKRKDKLQSRRIRGKRTAENTRSSLRHTVRDAHDVWSNNFCQR